MKLTAVIATVLLWSAGVAWCSTKQAEPFSVQVDRLLETIKMPEEQLAAVPQVLRDLELVLNTHWPGVQVKPFGSTVTGLALVGSDIDAYAVLPDSRIRSYGPINFKALPVLKQFPDYTDITPSLFFVTFQYIPWQTKIDLLFNNLEGGRNSELLRYYLHLDERAFKLAMIVKYWWGKVREQTGYKIVPTYGMTVLVVFYLQQKGMLPSVELLQKRSIPLFYEEWNLGFDEVEYKPRGNESLYQLVGGFFEYFNDFNYDEYIISPFVGHPLKRKLFKRLANVPPKFRNYRHNIKNGIGALDLNDAMIIQEPFFHNKNLAVTVVTREGSPLTTEFQRIARSYREEDETRFLNELLDVQIT